MHWSRRLIVLAAVVFFLACLLHVGWARGFIRNPWPSQPRIACAEAVYDFGEVPTGGFVEHVFTIENRGQADLEITRTQSECGCAVLDVPEKTIRPGEARPVAVKLSLRNLRGAVEKRIVVFGNDPKQASLVLTLKGRAATSIEVFPERIALGTLRSDSEVTQLVEVKPRPASVGFRVIKAWCEPAGTLTIRQQDLPEKRTVRFFVQPKGPLSAGPFQALLRVQTGPHESRVNHRHISTFGGIQE